MCFFAYMVAWMPVWLLPFDMIGLQAREESGMRCNELSYSWLQFTWMVIYVMNLSSGYLTYDFARRSYLDAGGFTIRMRIYQALISVVQWYAVATVITLSIIFAIAFGTGRYSDGVFWDWTFTVAFALANFYAVGIFIWWAPLAVAAAASRFLTRAADRPSRPLPCLTGCLRMH